MERRGGVERHWTRAEEVEPRSRRGLGETAGGKSVDRLTGVRRPREGVVSSLGHPMSSGRP